MSLRDALAGLPDDTRIQLSLSVGELREALDRDNPDRDLTTAEASEEFGHSLEWWTRRASEVPGAWQEAEGSPWSLPRWGCRQYLASLRRKGARNGGWRGPNAPTRRTRAADSQEGPVVGRGPSSVGPREVRPPEAADAA